MLFELDFLKNIQQHIKSDLNARLRVAANQFFRKLHLKTTIFFYLKTAVTNEYILIYPISNQAEAN